MKKNNNISVVVLSYNTVEITDKCLSLAEKAISFTQLRLQNKVELIVVDNGSTDGTIEMINKKHKKVTLLLQEKNVGVAKGYNIGMKHSKNPYILIINNDTFIEKNTLLKCINFLDGNQNCDVIMCRLTDGKGKFSPYGGHLPTPLRTISWLFGLESIPILKRNIKRIYQYNSNFYQKPNRMEWAPTCFYFMRKSVFTKTKGHDEKMFFYMEDIEWSKRIFDMGIQIWFVNSISSIHLGGESTRKKLKNKYLLSRQLEGLRYYYKKHFKNEYLLVNTCIYLGFGLRSLIYFLVGQKEQSKVYFEVLFTKI